MRRFTILIVDDEPIEREAIRLIIQNGFDDIDIIGEAQNGFEALDVFRREAPDIVILDINMPGMDGLETIQQINLMGKTSHFVIVTSYSRFEYAQMAIRLGVEDFLIKPTTIVSISSTLKAVKAKIEQAEVNSIAAKRMERRIEAVEPIIEHDILRMLLEKGPHRSFKEMFRLTELNPGKAFVTLIYVGEKEDEVRAKIQQKLKESGLLVLAGPCENEKALFLIMSEEERLIRREETLKFIGMIIEAAGVVTYRICAGPVVDDLEELGDSFYFAERCFKVSMETGKQVCTEADLVGEPERLSLNSMILIGAGKDLKMNSLMQAALDYICRNFTRSIDLQDLSSYLQASPSHVSKTIRKYLDKTFSELLTELRVEEAQRLLKESSLSVKEITFEVGYNSQHYFSRIFKRYCHISPSEYRELANNDQASDLYK
jgi:YesN/AraC family two-component response regulator